MTFYLCTTGIHTQLTSGRGKKEATLKATHPEGCVEGCGGGGAGGGCEEAKASVITSDGKVNFNVHMTETVYSCQGGCQASQASGVWHQIFS